MKILVVEDDVHFSEAICDSLDGSNYTVFTAENGRIAKNIVELHQPDIVLSDVQMPFFNGIELLEWYKEKFSGKFILMTGFSHLLETQRADELGADGFIAKPFKDADLINLINSFAPNAEPENSTESNQTTDDFYCQVSIEDFVTEREVSFEIYLRLRKDKFVKILHTGGKIDPERVKTYKQKGLSYLYVPKTQFKYLVSFNLNLNKKVQQSTLPAEKKKRFLQYTGETILDNVYSPDIDQDSFNYAKSFSEAALTTLADEDSMFELIELMKNHSNKNYIHSLSVATYSVMIAKSMGWHSPATQFKLFMGGMLHDIGKKEIESELLEKPRPLLTQEERSKIETHPVRGAEILEEMDNVPSDVVAIVAQHHENNRGTGFPRRLEKEKIHPLAKIVFLANVFCMQLEKNIKLGSSKVSGKELSENILSEYEGLVDKNILQSLFDLFH